MQCPQCGDEIQQLKQFCPSCGAKLMLVGEPISAAATYESPEQKAPVIPKVRIAGRSRIFGGICILIYCLCQWGAALSASPDKNRTNLAVLALLGAAFFFSRDWNERGRSRLRGGINGFGMAFVSGTLIYFATAMITGQR